MIADWADAPPLVFLVESLVYGLGGGKPKGATNSEADINKLVDQAGPLLPRVVRDPGLPKTLAIRPVKSPI